MSDQEFIVFLWTLLWDDLADGDVPSQKDLDILLTELTKRKILDGEFPS